MIKCFFMITFDYDAFFNVSMAIVSRITLKTYC